eukprot:GHVO01033228.1.p1 GENE.GHVO01033228.1~~GHVO01033228.1.p1  ORF type:complete len:294 (+),score=63.11 GHVO01033228.1:53-883(+)
MVPYISDTPSTPLLCSEGDVLEDVWRDEGKPGPGHYRRTRCIGRGAFGEVWRGQSYEGDVVKNVVLKRIYNSDEKKRSGLREAYFGRLLAPTNTACGFIEIFEESVPPQNGDAPPPNGIDDYYVWLVFTDEGHSLRQWMYTVKDVVIPSDFWWSMKGPGGISTLRRIVRGLLNALDTAHALGVVHRDVKPSNIMMSPATFPNVKLCDWGSGVPYIKETEKPLVSFNEEADDPPGPSRPPPPQPLHPPVSPHRSHPPRRDVRLRPPRGIVHRPPPKR